jgi:hypothetical protein
MAGIVDLFTGDLLRTVLIAQGSLGLLSSCFIADPSVALALFGLVAIIQGHQTLVQLFIFFNAASIILDVFRLAIAEHVGGFFLLVILQLAGMLCKAYVTYQCYDLFGMGGGSAAGGDGSEYQPAAAGPRHDPFYEPPPSNPNLYAPQPAHEPAGHGGEQL